MKAISKPLEDFITDFNFKKKDNNICFDAIVYFSTANDILKISTEVHIVTINDEFDFVYLLQPNIPKQNIPDSYSIGSEKFNYLKDMALIIKGHTPLYGEYILSIHPSTKECDDATLKEIHSKTYN